MSDKIETEFKIEQFINDNTIERAERMLKGYINGVATAVKAALKATNADIKKNAYVELSKRYDISRESIRDYQNIKTFIYQRGSLISGSVIFTGNKIPLYRYNGTTPKEPEVDTSRKINVFIYGGFKKINPSLPVKAHQLKSKPAKDLVNAFVARMQSEHVGIFKRKLGSRKISEIMGLSVPQMIGNNEVQKNVIDSAMEGFDKLLNEQIDRIISGAR